MYREVESLSKHIDYRFSLANTLANRVNNLIKMYENNLEISKEVLLKMVDITEISKLEVTSIVNIPQYRIHFTNTNTADKISDIFKRMIIKTYDLFKNKEDLVKYLKLLEQSFDTLCYNKDEHNYYRAVNIHILPIIEKTEINKVFKKKLKTEHKDKVILYNVYDNIKK